MSGAEGQPARVVLAEQIRKDHERMHVCAWPYLPEQVTPGHPVVSVYREKMLRQGAVLEHQVKLDIFVSLTDGDLAEAEAEDALDDVCLSLQRIAGLTWSEATRVTFADDFAGYTISGVMHSADIYKQEIAAERRRLSITK